MGLMLINSMMVLGGAYVSCKYVYKKNKKLQFGTFCSFLVKLQQYLFLSKRTNI